MGAEHRSVPCVLRDLEKMLEKGEVVFEFHGSISVGFADSSAMDGYPEGNGDVVMLLTITTEGKQDWLECSLTKEQAAILYEKIGAFMRVKEKGPEPEIQEKTLH